MRQEKRGAKKKEMREREREREKEERERERKRGERERERERERTTTKKYFYKDVSMKSCLQYEKEGSETPRIDEHEGG